EMGEVMADHFGGTPGDYICGDVEFLSPFKFGREEALIFMGLREKGFNCGIGGPMPMAGATGPVTLAGILTQHIAETLFRSIVTRVMNNFKILAFGSGFGIMDMQTGYFSRSRPENALLHLALGQIVHKVYHGHFRGHTFGLNDAPCPSLEAGFQNAMNVFTGLLAGNRHMGAMGVICQTTSVISSLQLILDNECVGMVKRFMRNFEINEETIAFDVVKEVGPGGNFLEQMHTAEHFRNEHWQPSLFNRKTYHGWLQSGGMTDLDKARDIYYEIMKKDDPEPKIDEASEKELMRIIRKAETKIL
ncbi:MAG: trimethylamine methyltransferase family protein, partial [Victivallaceae bacterium]|nr:trimethylamine methyltransferase family protein [Victivallaceae bacterium]